MSNFIDFLTPLSFIPNFHDFFFMFIHKSINNLSRTFFGETYLILF